MANLLRMCFIATVLCYGGSSPGDVLTDCIQRNPSPTNVFIVLQESRRGVEQNDDQSLDLFNSSNYLMDAYRYITANQSVHRIIRVRCDKLRSLVAYLHNWYSVYVVVVPTSAAPVLLTSLRSSTQTPPQSVWTACLDESANIAKAIASIWSQLAVEKHLLIYTEQYSIIAEVLQKYGNATLAMQWKVSSANIDMLTLANYVARGVRGFIVAVGSNWQQIIHVARSQQFTLSDWQWIVLIHGGSKTEWEGALLPGEKILIAQYGISRRNGTCRKWSSYQTAASIPLWVLSLGRRRMMQVSTWKPDVALTRSLKHLWRFTSFFNRTLKIATLHLPIFHFKETINGTTVWSGICIEILKALAETLNFRYELVEPEDQSWGAIRNGTWNGMVAMVYNGEVDFALGKFTVTNIRDTVIDFTAPFWHEPAQIAMRRPEQNSLFVYFGPFKYDVWICLLFAVPLAALSMSVVYYAECEITDPSLAAPEFRAAFDMTMWFTFCSLLQQGATWIPRTQGTRFVVGCWWFFAIIMGATYTGNLIAVLTVPKAPLPVQSLAELAAQSEYTYGTVENAAIYQLIQHSSFSVYQQLWKKSVRHKKYLVSNHREGMERAIREKYIYLGEMSGVAPVAYKDCRYAMGKEEFFPSSFAFVFPENSPYIPVVNHRIMNLIENGMIQRWRRKYYPVNQCLVSGSGLASTKPATIEDVQGIFILLFAGVVLGTLVLFVEYCIENAHSWCWVKFVSKLYRACRGRCRRQQQQQVVGANADGTLESGALANGNAIELKSTQPAAKKGTIFAVAGVGMTYKQSNKDGGIGAIASDKRKGVERWYYKRRDLA